MLQLSVWHNPLHTIHFSEGHRQLKCQAYTFTENTLRDYFLCLCMMNVFPLHGQSPVARAFMLRIQPVSCTGLIHDLVEGAAKGRGGTAAFQLQYGYDPHSYAPCCNVPYLLHMLLSSEIQDCSQWIRYRQQSFGRAMEYVTWFMELNIEYRTIHVT